MKNRKLTIGLLVIAIVVWSIIIYKFVSRSATDSGGPVTHVMDTGAIWMPIPPDTIRIDNDYDDPFRIDKKPAVKISHKPAPVIKQPVKVQAPWPTLKFRGLIKNQSSNSSVALLLVNGKSNIMKKGETIDNLQLMEMWRDSVKVRYNGEIRYVGKD